MRVTPGMLTVSGSPLIKEADFLDVYDRGLQVAREGDLVCLHADSLSTAGKRFLLDLEDAQGVMEKMAEVIEEIRRIYG
jgi:hypothetical protein